MIFKPVCGAHLKQILVTIACLTVVEPLIIVLWGPEEIYLNRPEAIKGADALAGSAQYQLNPGRWLLWLGA